MATKAIQLSATQSVADPDGVPNSWSLILLPDPPDIQRIQPESACVGFNDGVNCERATTQGRPYLAK
ncbi:hypothetical protein EZS27_032019 [termite gut metagenome]|uniref:Uncharacterized protein n=1 Tax=termite gut metagenome TaxID=433724 RepID=A0A5J4Q9S9_9ZZZZ